MKSRSILLATTITATLVAAGGIGALRAQDAKAPVYTAQQEARGAAQFNANCSQCHGKNLEGVEAPALSGLDVMGNWVTAQGLFDYISVAMPPTAAGQLGQDVYIDIISHILAVNGAPAGSKPLTLADLPGVNLVAVTGVTAASGGPKPAAASAAAGAPAQRLPQAFTAGKQLPTVAAGTTAVPPPSDTGPKLPQAFTAGKQLPTVTPGSTSGTGAVMR